MSNDKMKHRKGIHLIVSFQIFLFQKVQLSLSHYEQIMTAGKKQSTATNVFMSRYIPAFSCCQKESLHCQSDKLTDCNCSCTLREAGYTELPLAFYISDTENQRTKDTFSDLLTQLL